MRITDLISINSIELDSSVSDKREALNRMIDLMVAGGNIIDAAKYKEGVFKREEESTTGIGEGIAIPHAKSDGVKAAGIAAMIVKDGVDFDSLDGEPVHVIFLIAAPDTKDNVHLEVLSKLSVLLMDNDFIDKLKAASTKEEFLNIIDETESARDLQTIQKKSEEADRNTADTNNNAVEANSKLFLAVTGCPTGIAHTFMAAESLEKAAKAGGYRIKVETRGSGGAKNVLSAEEIREADCIIVASDTKVPMDRFNGKRVIQVQVSDGISKATELLKRADSGNVAVYQASGAGAQRSHGNAENSVNTEDTGNTTAGGGIGHRIYTHLMNGVSHMLPFVVGGGILIAIAFLIDGFSVDLESLPSSAEEAALLGQKYSKADFGTINEVAAVFKNIGGVAFGFMLPVLAGYIAMSIADRPGLVVGFVGGMIAGNGKSGFLGALVAGFLAGYLIIGLRKLFSKLPDSLEGMKPILLYPVLGVLFIGLLMMYIIEPPVGTLNTWLNNALNSMGGANRIILGIILGGMMAADMGGPINKAAYVFGTAMITQGNYNMMAAVMIGGMVPPCAIALATLLFKNRFSEEERKSGPVNFIMGLAFITEGAIPYAASDPLRVLPACVIGSATAGALSMAFGCTLMAPHGGIFVFPVVGNALLYLLSLVIGTVVGAVLLGLFKQFGGRSENN